MSDRVTVTMDLDDLAFAVLSEASAKNRRSPGDEAAIRLEEALFWEKYGQFERPDDPDQPRRSTDNDLPGLREAIERAGRTS